MLRGTWGRKFSFCLFYTDFLRIFSLWSSLRAFMTLKKQTPDVPAVCRSPPHSTFPFLDGLNVCMNNLILRNFMTWKKKKTGRNARELLIFTLFCLFLLFHFLLIASVERRKLCECRAGAFVILRRAFAPFVDASARASTVERFGSLSPSGEGRNSFFCIVHYK
jgi:hypothetical protein